MRRVRYFTWTPGIITAHQRPTTMSCMLAYTHIHTRTAAIHILTNVPRHSGAINEREIFGQRAPPVLKLMNDCLGNMPSIETVRTQGQRDTPARFALLRYITLSRADRRSTRTICACVHICYSFPLIIFTNKQSNSVRLSEWHTNSIMWLHSSCRWICSKTHLSGPRRPRDAR